MSIDLYPPFIKQDDLSPDEGFGADIDEDCELLNGATKGFGADADTCIACLGAKDAVARWKLARRYQELYDKPLTKLMKDEFSGDFGRAMKMLAMPIDEAECYMLKKAFEGLGCNVKVIYSILVGRSNDEINRIKKNYFKLYTKDLGKQLASELHGDMERLVFNCFQAGEEPYDPQFHTEEKAQEDADEIYEKGQGKFFGTDEKKIFKILCASPPEHIANIDKAYAEKRGYTLSKAIEKELNGNVRDATIHLVGMKTKPYHSAAAMIKEACKGIGTDELLLTTCIVRYQYVLKDVMAAHIEEYGKTIHERVKSETSGNYKELLLTVLNAVWPEEG
ncbi:unnamed protein product [Cylindrotheca closterium]|uniref:Annexin n=1 Tax=Cylindrotheca closterium TaxID=2856 RepID=A0AAD2FF43_9STRA|nr:unnamed protein product [Cylindrotheca closterium]